MRGVVKGKRWLLLTRWMNLDSQKRQQLNELLALNRRVMKAYLLRESLERLWTYRYEGAMLRYLQSWIDQLRWQRLKPFENLAFMLLESGILRSFLGVDSRAARPGRAALERWGTGRFLVGNIAGAAGAYNRRHLPKVLSEPWLIIDFVFYCSQSRASRLTRALRLMTVPRKNLRARSQ